MLTSNLKKKWFPSLLCACFWISGALVPAIAQTKTETINVLGQQIRFTNPRGYCTPGNSERERDLMTRGERLLGPSVRLVHVAILCSELEDYRSERRETVDHWLQIQLIGPGGDFKRVGMGREAFLGSLVKADSKRVNTEEINRRLQRTLENTDLSLSNIQVEDLGRDGNAIYFFSRMTINQGDNSRPITSLHGLTLLNSLPLTVNVYEGTSQIKSRDQLQPVLQQLLQSLLTKN